MESGLGSARLQEGEWETNSSLRHDLVTYLTEDGAKTSFDCLWAARGPSRPYRSLCPFWEMQLQLTGLSWALDSRHS